MNERIKELAVQSDLWRMLDEYSWEFGSCDPEKDCGRIEKFAELIVRECLSIVENNNPRPPGTTIMYSLAKDEYFDTGWQVAVETKSNQIKEHFGVEE
jgi:hypothetical protein